MKREQAELLALKLYFKNIDLGKKSYRTPANIDLMLKDVKEMADKAQQELSDDLDVTSLD